MGGYRPGSLRAGYNGICPTSTRQFRPVARTPGLAIGASYFANDETAGWRIQDAVIDLTESSSRQRGSVSAAPRGGPLPLRPCRAAPLRRRVQPSVELPHAADGGGIATGRRWCSTPAFRKAKGSSILARADTTDGSHQEGIRTPWSFAPLGLIFGLVARALTRRHPTRRPLRVYTFGRKPQGQNNSESAHGRRGGAGGFAGSSVTKQPEGRCRRSCLVGAQDAVVENGCSSRGVGDGSLDSTTGRHSSELTEGSRRCAAAPATSVHPRAPGQSTG